MLGEGEGERGGQQRPTMIFETRTSVRSDDGPAAEASSAVIGVDATSPNLGVARGVWFTKRAQIYRFRCVALLVVWTSLLLPSASAIEAGQQSNVEEWGDAVTRGVPLLATVAAPQERSYWVPGLEQLVLSVSDAYVLGTCKPNGKSFRLCINALDRVAEDGQCHTKQSSTLMSTSTILSVLRGPISCSKAPLTNALKAIAGRMNGSNSSSEGALERSSCYVPANPYLAYNASIQVFQGTAQCGISSTYEMSQVRLACVVGGLCLILISQTLFHFVQFRVGFGALASMLFGVLITGYFCLRSPRKSTVVSAVVFLIGHYQRWWNTVLLESNLNKIAAAYCIIFACLGAGVTYYFDSAFTSGKMFTISTAGIQMMGAMMIFLSSQSPAVSVALISLGYTCQCYRLVAVREFVRMSFAREASRTKKDESLLAQERVLTHKGSPMKGAMGRPGSPVVHTHTASPGTPFKAKEMRLSADRGEDESVGVADCVKRGEIYNEKTRRLIQIGKGTYNKLVKSGYVVDEGLGTISPPPKARSD